MTLKYDKILRPDGPDPANPLAPPASAFSVEVEGQPVAVTRTQINAEYLQLRLARELSPQEQQVTVSYARPATNPVQTNIGGLAFDFTDYPVEVSRAPTTGNSKLSVADAEVTEGEGTMDFVVTLAPAKHPPAWVHYATADGTARAGEDYRARSGRVKFGAWETTKTVSVPIINDAVEEDGETFTLVLSDPEGALIADGEATGTILDDGDEGVQPPRPPQNTGTELFSETMTMGYDPDNTWAGYHDGSGGVDQIGMLPRTGFSFGDSDYTVEQVTNSDAGQLELRLSGELTQEDAAPLDLYIGNTLFGLAEADGYGGNRNLRVWDDSGLVLRSGSTILVRIVDRRPAMTGTFENVPRNHNSPFTFEVHFSEEVVVSAETLRDHAFAVTNGEVTGARQLNPPSTMAWEITVASFSEEAVTLVLPETTDCAAAGAICTEDGRMLSADISAVVEGPGATPEPLTATFGDVPSEHTGQAFTFGLAFSEEVEISYETLRDDAFEVTGGSVTTASRTAPPSNQEWAITVEPASSSDTVAITLPETTDCGAAGAICTGGDDPRPLSNSPSAHRGGGGGGAGAADGDLRRRHAGLAHGRDVHVRAELQRGTRLRLQLQDAARRRVQRDRREPEECEPADAGQQPRVGDHGRAGFHERHGDHHAAGDDRLRRDRGDLHRGRPSAVALAVGDRQRGLRERSYRRQRGRGRGGRRAGPCGRRDPGRGRGGVVRRAEAERGPAGRSRSAGQRERSLRPRRPALLDRALPTG